MSTLGKIVRHYDVLTPRERLILVLAALAREDEHELQRLRLSCPRNVYEQLDAAFLDLLEGTETIADKFLLLWLTASRATYCGQVMMLVARRRLVEAAKTDPTADDEIDRQMELWRSHLAHWAGVLVGYRRFCERVELDPDQVLAAWYPPVKDEIPAMEALLAEVGVEPDEESVEGTAGMLAAWWPPFRDAT